MSFHLPGFKVFAWECLDLRDHVENDPKLYNIFWRFGTEGHINHHLIQMMHIVVEKNSKTWKLGLFKKFAFYIFQEPSIYRYCLFKNTWMMDEWRSGGEVSVGTLFGALPIESYSYLLENYL